MLACAFTFLCGSPDRVTGQSAPTQVHSTVGAYAVDELLLRPKAVVSFVGFRRRCLHPCLCVPRMKSTSVVILLLPLAFSLLPLHPIASEMHPDETPATAVEPNDWNITYADTFADDRKFWTEGTPLILDDSFEHELWTPTAKATIPERQNTAGCSRDNFSDYRIVVLVDIWKPS
eukprot:m.969415 g.969415  ORF g.969415 m.969415 type:complete len:175 (-) comp23920_c0_seq3:2084-2608(-)